MGAVRYFVSDLESAIAFYSNQLGFECLERWGPAFAMMQWEDTQLWLAGPETSAAKPMPDGKKPEPGGWNRIVVQVEELDVLANSLRESGIRFRGEILSGPGGSQVLIEDPDGNPIELFCPH